MTNKQRLKKRFTPRAKRYIIRDRISTLGAGIMIVFMKSMHGKPLAALDIECE